jgi:hypothetical protein
MKRASISLLALTLAFVFACQPAQNGNGNGNANGNKSSIAAQSTDLKTILSDKVVQIFIEDDRLHPGFYLIEDPGPVRLRKTKKIVWCVIYTGASTPPTEVVMDNFRYPPPPATPTASNPFGDGSDDDNRFIIPSADFNCKNRTKTPKTDVVIGSYKYNITAKVGTEDRGHLDPVVIIDN